MKQVFRFLCAASILLLVCGLFTFAAAQTTDQIVAQITSSASNSFANDISGDGRYVVIESLGNIATVSPSNADGNREIFLFDNAQNRIFQITNTQSALNDKTKSSTDPTNIRIEIDNVRPVISRDGRFIVFSSNAPTPAAYNANSLDDATLSSLTRTDGFNTELFIYQIPTVNDKSNGALTRITTTQSSRTPQAGSSTRAPFIADDNRDAAISDDGSIIAFASTTRVATDTPSGAANTDGNSEIFIYSTRTGTFTQLTNTQGDFVFNDNPSLSADGSTIAFISNAIIAGGDNNDDGRGNGNAELFIANVNRDTVAVTNAPRQITRTKASATNSIAITLSPGRRLSRDGNFLAFESSATSPTANDGVNQVGAAVFVYNVATNSFSQFGPRSANANNEVIRFPTFTDYQTSNGSTCTDANRATCTTPTTLVFASRLSFTASGDAPSSPTDASSLNPNSTTQIFSVPLSQPNPVTTPPPPTPTNRFTRLTNTPAPAVSTIPLTQPLPSDSLQRIAFSLNATELGGGNADNSTEVFYLVSRTGTTNTGATVSFFTRFGLLPVTPGAAAPAVAGLAPGQLAIINLGTAMSLQVQPNQNASTFEMNGISVSVNNTAALIYFASANQIQFVVPPGLATSAANAPANVVIFNSNNNTVTRATLPIVAAQPDVGIAENTNNRASVFNVTGGMMNMSEPFSVTTTTSNGQTQPTVLGIRLTGVRNAQPSQVTVTIGTTDITGAAIQANGQTNPGFDEIDVQIPASLAGLKDQPVIVRVTIGGTTFTSRTDNPPRISFQ